MDERGTARRFGDRARFSVEVGEIIPVGLRTVDLWAGGKWLTTDDNAAFLPMFPRRTSRSGSGCCTGARRSTT